MRFTKPKKGGIELPTLSNPASAENVQSGFEVIGADGIKIIGTHEEEPGLDTSDATATAANIDNGKTAYINGVKVTGTSNKVDTSDATATAADIGAGKTAYGKSGKITGTGKVLDYLITGVSSTFLYDGGEIPTPSRANIIRGGGSDGFYVAAFVNDSKLYAREKDDKFSINLQINDTCVIVPRAYSYNNLPFYYTIGKDKTL